MDKKEFLEKVLPAWDGTRILTLAQSAYLWCEKPPPSKLDYDNFPNDVYGKLNFMIEAASTNKDKKVKISELMEWWPWLFEYYAKETILKEKKEAIFRDKDKILEMTKDEALRDLSYEEQMACIEEITSNDKYQKIFINSAYKELVINIKSDDNELNKSINLSIPTLRFSDLPPRIKGNLIDALDILNLRKPWYESISAFNGFKNSKFSLGEWSEVTVSRDALIEWANHLGEKPLFLFPEEREEEKALEAIEAEQPAEQQQVEGTGQMKPAFAFKRSGQNWLIGDEKNPKSVNNSQGTPYLQKLLENPYKTYGPFDLGSLARAVEKPLNNTMKEMTKGQLEELGLNKEKGLGDAGFKIDEKAKADYQKRIKKIDDEILEQKNIGFSEGEEQIDKLENEKKTILKEIQAGISKGGHPRMDKSHENRLGGAIRQNMKRVLEKIIKQCPKLKPYLNEKTIENTGKNFSYKPNPDNTPRWIFQ